MKAPGYSGIIRRPMEMDTIEEKIENTSYASPVGFVDDILLMLNNCRLYNGPDNEYTETADELEEMFKVIFKNNFKSFCKLNMTGLEAPSIKKKFESA